MSCRSFHCFSLTWGAALTDKEQGVEKIESTLTGRPVKHRKLTHADPRYPRAGNAVHYIKVDYVKPPSFYTASKRLV